VVAHFELNPRDLSEADAAGHRGGKDIAQSCIITEDFHYHL